MVFIVPQTIVTHWLLIVVCVEIILKLSHIAFCVLNAINPH